MSSPMPTTTPPATPPTVIPFPLPWGQTGCCPPGGMDALMQCYCDIQAATKFITTIMIDAINNNPAVAQAIIAAIEKSGSNLPTLGVTNGAAAQPGQVGEWVRFTQTVAVPATVSVQSLNMGILQPGDWDIDTTAWPTVFLSTCRVQLNPQPAGFSDNMYANFNASGTGESTTLTTGRTQALISVPSLVVLQLATNEFGTGAAGNVTVNVSCRRMR